MNAWNAAQRLACVERHGWNVTRAARRLRIAGSTLRRWLAGHGHERPAWSKLRGARRQSTVRIRSTELGLEKFCRWCPDGGAWLPLEDCFHATKSGAMGRSNICKACKYEREARREGRPVPARRAA